MNFLYAVVAFVSMECVAWTTHKYIMHGWLWSLHKDHHKKETAGFFEKNDYFFLIFALPGVALFIIGGVLRIPAMEWIAGGITAYGLCYFWVHDVFIHQRFRLFRKADNFYLKALRRAHKMHHKQLGKEDGECFGMLLVPWKYFREALKEQRRTRQVL